MRIVAGKFRHRQIRAPRSAAVRPTSDRLRETLFNVLAAGGGLEDSVWLDVFAGSGAVGIEALSRGARQVYFIESARDAAATIRANLKALGIEDGFEVMEREALTSLRRLDAQAVVADFVFLDPPYKDESAYEETLCFLSQSQMLKPESVVIAEHDKHFALAGKFGALARYRELRQGDAVLSFFRKQ